jgi:hypothetical protein
MYWLLFFIPASVVLEHTHVSPPVLFFSAGMSILPIARLIVLGTVQLDLTAIRARHAPPESVRAAARSTSSSIRRP